MQSSESEAYSSNPTTTTITKFTIMKEGKEDFSSTVGDRVRLTPDPTIPNLAGDHHGNQTQLPQHRGFGSLMCRHTLIHIYNTYRTHTRTYDTHSPPAYSLDLSLCAHSPAIKLCLLLDRRKYIASRVNYIVRKIVRNEHWKLLVLLALGSRVTVLCA